MHTDSAGAVVEALQANRNCDVFIDEGGETMRRDPCYQFLATRARQYGHRVFFIAQRANQLLPVIRKNCTAVYCFRQCASDARLLSDDFAVDFSQASSLGKGEYLQYLGLGSEVVKKRLF